ncbi:hypothetical protein BOX15_Mlig015199g1, partial [Macrostomum lignano]
VITKPFEYAVKRTPTRMGLMIAAVWLLSAFISIPPMFGWKEQFVRATAAIRSCLATRSTLPSGPSTCRSSSCWCCTATSSSWPGRWPKPTRSRRWCTSSRRTRTSSTSSCRTVRLRALHAELRLGPAEAVSAAAGLAQKEQQRFEGHQDAGRHHGLFHAVLAAVLHHSDRSADLQCCTGRETRHESERVRVFPVAWLREFLHEPYHLRQVQSGLSDAVQAHLALPLQVNQRPVAS